MRETQESRAPRGRWKPSTLLGGVALACFSLWGCATTSHSDLLSGAERDVFIETEFGTRERVQVSEYHSTDRDFSFLRVGSDSWESCTSCRVFVDAPIQRTGAAYGAFLATVGYIFHVDTRHNGPDGGLQFLYTPIVTLGGALLGGTLQNSFRGQAQIYPPIEPEPEYTAPNSLFAPEP